jgi:hypothetical protein
MRKLASDVWDEIGRQYRAGIVVNVLAKTFKVSCVTIERKAIQFGWIHDQADQGDPMAPRQEGGTGSSQEPRQAAAAHGSDPRAVLMDRQSAAWEEVYALWEDASRLLKGQKPKLVLGLAGVDGEDRLALAAALITMFEKATKSVMTAQEGERRAYGYDYKQQQVSQVEDEATARRRAELIRSFLSAGDGVKQRAERADAIERRDGKEL